MERIGKKLLRLGLFCFLVGAVGLIYYFSKYHELQPSMVTYNQQFVAEAKDVKSIDIVTETSDVSFTISNLEQISLRLVGEVKEKKKDSLTFSHQVAPDGTLQIRVDEPSDVGMSFGPTTALQLQVILPKKLYDQVKITTMTGDISTSALEANSYSLKSMAGEIRVESFKGKELQVETHTGDIHVKELDGKAEITSITGDIDKLVLLRLADDLSVQTDTGDISVVFKAKPEAARLNLQSDTGEIRSKVTDVNYETKEEHELKGTIGTNGPTVKVRSATGDISLEQEK